MGWQLFNSEFMTTMAGTDSHGAGAIAKCLINKQEPERANWERCGLLEFKPSDTPLLRHSPQPFLNIPTTWEPRIHMYELMKAIALIQTTTRTRTVSDPREYRPTLLSYSQGDHQYENSLTFYIFIYLACIQAPWHMYEDQRSTWRIQLAPSITWVPRLGAECLYPLSQLTDPANIK